MGAKSSRQALSTSFDSHRGAVKPAVVRADALGAGPEFGDGGERTAAIKSGMWRPRSGGTGRADCEGASFHFAHWIACSSVRVGNRIRK